MSISEKALYVLFALAWLGVNSLAYSGLVAFCFRSDRLPDRHPKLRGIFTVIFTILSFPGIFVIQPAYKAFVQRAYDLHQKDKQEILRVAEMQGKPQSWEANLHGWDVDRYVDEFGHFDLHGWKQHEYGKHGL